MAGTLYVVATPIGNLEDLSPRARHVLSSVAVIACEDTRHSGAFLRRIGVDVPLVSCHRFNERARLAPLLERLDAGDDVALVSDSGTPAVSDPGARLVEAVLERQGRVTPVPGPSAVTTLLSVGGIGAERFVFEGFLPARPGTRRRRLRELAEETRPVVFFEAPHRVRATLADLAAIFGSRPLVLGRELTKLHESVLRGEATALAERLGDAPRGEIVILVPPGSRPAGTEDDERAERVRRTWRSALEAEGGDRREALAHAARELGLKKPELRRLLDELRII